MPHPTALPTPLGEAEQRMLVRLCQLDGVDATEAVRRAVRLAFFARLVPDELLDAVLGHEDPDLAGGWRPTGELRVSVHGDLVSERVNREGATKWVPASDAEVEAWLAKGRRA